MCIKVLSSQECQVSLYTDNWEPILKPFMYVLMDLDFSVEFKLRPRHGMSAKNINTNLIVIYGSNFHIGCDENAFRDRSLGPLMKILSHDIFLAEILKLSYNRIYNILCLKWSNMSRNAKKFFSPF